MKLKPILAVGLFAITAAFTLNTNAAADTPTDTKPDAMMNHQGMMKHEGIMPQVEEKLDSTSKPKDAAPVDVASVKIKPAKDKSKHFHPRDGGKL